MVIHLKLSIPSPDIIKRSDLRPPALINIWPDPLPNFYPLSTNLSLSFKREPLDKVSNKLMYLGYFHNFLQLRLLENAQNIYSRHKESRLYMHKNKFEYFFLETLCSQVGEFLVLFFLNIYRWHIAFQMQTN